MDDSKMLLQTSGARRTYTELGTFWLVLFTDTSLQIDLVLMPKQNDEDIFWFKAIICTKEQKFIFCIDCVVTNCKLGFLY